MSSLKSRVSDILFFRVRDGKPFKQLNTLLAHHLAPFCVPLVVHGVTQVGNPLSTWISSSLPFESPVPPNQKSL
jgi:hypothetical protein